MEKPAPHDHPLHELVARRWSPRAFDGRAVSRAQIASLLEAARWAPSCFNEQPWRFLVASREDDAAFTKALGCLAETNQTWAKNAGVLFFTTAKKTFSRNDKPNRHAPHDIGLAAENLVLQALSDGLFAHQMAGIDVDKIRSEYGVPDDFDILTGIAVGHPGDSDDLPEKLRAMEEAERTRKTMAEIAFTGRWEEPFRP